MAELKGLKRKREGREQHDSLAEVPASRPVLPDNVMDSYVSCEIALRGLNVKSNFADLLVSGVNNVDGTAVHCFMGKTDQVPWKYWKTLCRLRASASEGTTSWNTSESLLMERD